MTSALQRHRVRFMTMLCVAIRGDERRPLKVINTAHLPNPLRPHSNISLIHCRVHPCLRSSHVASYHDRYPFPARKAMTTGTPSATAKMQTQATSTASSSDQPSFESVGVKHTSINQAPGVNLSPHEKLVVGSVLDLFEGHPTLRHLNLWSRDATFADPLTVAEGYNRFAAQWYGLPTVFSPINLVSHTVTSAGNPIEIDLVNKYTLKGVKKEQEIKSKVKIFLDKTAGGKITKVEDRWNDKLPDGVISQAFRKLNAVTVPMMVKVPKTQEEDDQMRAAREG